VGRPPYHSFLGFEVGSHTQSHARLADVSDPARLELEITGSKRAIEKELGTECRYFAWPFGRWRDVGEEAIDMVVSSGYHGCFGGYRGSVICGKTTPWRIPRHHLDASWPWAHIRYFACGMVRLRRSARPETPIVISKGRRLLSGFLNSPLPAERPSEITENHPPA